MTGPTQAQTDAIFEQAARASALWEALLREGIALLIRDTLEQQIAQPELLLITRLRQSGMATLTGTAPDLRLTMLGIIVTAPSLRGVLRDWATEVLSNRRLT